MNVKRILTDAVMTVSTRRGLITALVQVDMSSSVTRRLALVRYFLHTHTINPVAISNYIIIYDVDLLLHTFIHMQCPSEVYCSR